MKLFIVRSCWLKIKIHESNSDSWYVDGAARIYYWREEEKQWKSIKVYWRRATFRNCMEVCAAGCVEFRDDGVVLLAPMPMFVDIVFLSAGGATFNFNQNSLQLWYGLVGIGMMLFL